ncbi:activating transcription factor 7-interacting protein 1-like isoform X1 [Pomacea canaliculata]|uniref:activating transcription factor 7-interacting protein 1-like isoform X1 n=1 Tax=Pomacea canaliculata TaxID=400727 RepID=UPI000D738E60|nr:activating transcription factor 7-interacting protein 1-like isoform X1 [Pomacea canaliculata]
MEDSESAEKHSEGVSLSASDDEDDRTSLSSPKTLRLTSKELDSVVRSKVKAYLARHQGAELRVMNARIQELMKSEEEWRNKAKDFERKLTELTLKQHKLEKRKAHTAALRSITTRNIGVQVNEEKLKANTPQKMSKTVPSGNGTPLSSAASPPSPVPALMLSSLPGQPKILTPVSCTSPPSKVTTITIGQNFGNRNTSVAQLLSQTARMPTAATSVSSSSKPVSVPSSNGPRQPSTLVPASNASVRSLLDQASSLSKVTTSNTISPTNLVFVNTSPGMPLVSKGMASGAVAGSAILTAATGVTTTPSNIKVIDLTMEDDGSAAKQGAKQMQVVASSGQMHNLMPQQMVRQITPISQGIQGPTSAILFSSSAGTQIVTAPNMPRPSGMIQVVTIANAAPLRPGSLLTVVSGQPALVRQPNPSTTGVSRSQTPQILAQPPPAMTIMRPAQVLGLSTTVRPSLATSTTTTTARMPVVATGVIPSSTAPVASQDANVPSKAKIRHPAPLPAAVTYHLPNETKPPPPQPGLKISRVKQGIVLSWNMTIPKDCVEIASYQLFAYQETSAPPSTSLWKKVGDVKALPLPMACTLTQFQDGNKYHFAVRAVDIHGRTSNFSDPAFIFLSKTS